LSGLSTGGSHDNTIACDDWTVKVTLGASAGAVGGRVSCNIASCYRAVMYI